MRFGDVIGQEDVKERLRQIVDEGRVPHAMLFSGPEGCGKLPMALAFASYLLCQDRQDGEPCGHCKSCKMLANRYEHPDLHFVYPIIKKGTSTPLCDEYGREWRELVSRNPYFSIREWLDAIDAGNSQLTIYSTEADEIVRKLTLSPAFGNYKVMIVWLPEKMQEVCSNKLLKFLEEPSGNTVFLFVTEDRNMIMQTILSRLQGIGMHPVKAEDIAGMLSSRYGVDAGQAAEIARISSGNVVKAIGAIHVDDETRMFFDLFVRLMRLSYQKKIKEMKEWSEEVAELGREAQKKFLAYCQRMLRENFVSNFHVPELVYMTSGEKDFSRRFAPFINERNVISMMQKFSDAERDIERNVNAKMVFFDMALNMIVEIAVKGRMQ